MAVTNRDLNLTIKSKYDGKGVKDATEDVKKFSSSVQSVGPKFGAVNTSLTSAFKNISSSLKTVGGAFSSVFLQGRTVLTAMADSIFSLKTAFLSLIGILGVGALVKGFIGINAEFEKIQVTMDVLTKGRGEEFFNRFNNWGLNMPISIAEVTKAFVTMKAYGLEPTTKMMENLVNVASLLPESGRAMVGIARAMGQIQAKGRLEGQELRQLAEWAVPGYEAVYTKIFEKISKKTGIAKEKLKFTMIDAATATKALWETIEEHFGGAAESISKTWSGLWIRMQNHFKEFIREIGESGAMAPLRDALKNIVEWLSEAFKSGEMKKFADFIVSSFSIVFGDMTKGLRNSKVEVKDFADVFIQALIGIVRAVSFLEKSLLGIKLVFLGIKFVWAGLTTMLYSGLFIIVGIINKIIEGWKLLVELLPSAIPGVETLKSVFKTVHGFSSGFADLMKDDMLIMGKMTLDTADAFAATGAEINNVIDNTDKMIAKLQINYKKYKETAAIPVAMEVAKTEYPNYGADVYIKDYGKEIAEMDKALLEYDKMLGMIEKNNQKVQKTLMSPKELHTAYQNHIAENGTFWQKMELGFEKYKEMMKKRQIKGLVDYFKDFFDSLRTGFSNAFQSILDGTATFSEGMQGILKSIEASFFSVISNMVANWLVGKMEMLATEIFIQKGLTAVTAEGEAERLGIESTSVIKSIAIAVGGAIKRITIYAYEAAAAAFKAIAGIPFVGPFLAIGAGAAALGLVLGFASKIAGFEKGTGLMGVRETGPALLHQGEIVLNKKESDAYRRGASEGGGGGSSNVSLSFNISSMDSSDMERVVRSKIIPLIRDNIRNNGQGKTMIREAR